VGSKYGLSLLLGVETFAATRWLVWSMALVIGADSEKFLLDGSRLSEAGSLLLSKSVVAFGVVEIGLSTGLVATSTDDFSVPGVFVPAI
jgi:hypothetical protein